MLSEEEKKAIDNLFNLQHINTYLNLSKESFRIENKTIIKWKESTDIVLNLITKLQKENEEKDNQIDLMIEEYEYNVRINFKNFCEDELRKDNCIQDCKSCAKQYFEKLVKEKG